MGFVFSNRLAFAKAATIPFAGLVLCVLLDMFLKTAMVNAATDVVTAVFLSMFSVKWHRFYLMGPEAATPSIGVRFGARERRFFFYLILLYGLFRVLNLLPDVASSEIGAVLILLLMLSVYLIILFLWGRIILVFPATAVGRGVGFFADIVGSWKTMRGNAFRVSGAIFLASILVLPPAGITIYAILVKGGWPWAFTIFPLAAAVEIVIGGIGVTIASIAFDRLTGWRNTTAESPA